MGNACSNRITLTNTQEAEFRNLLQLQITSLKNNNIPDHEITMKIYSFYGFHFHHKPTILIKTLQDNEVDEEDQNNGENTPISEMKSSHFIDFDPDDNIAQRIYDLFKSNQISDEEIKYKMSDFTGFLTKLEKEAQQSKKTAEISPTKQQKRKSFRGEGGNPIRRGSVELAPLARRGSVDLQPISRTSPNRKGLVTTTESNIASTGTLPMRRNSVIESLDRTLIISKKGNATDIQGERDKKKLVNISGKLQNKANNSNDSGDNFEDSYRSRRKAPLPWKQQQSLLYPTRDIVVPPSPPVPTEHLLALTIIKDKDGYINYDLEGHAHRHSQQDLKDLLLQQQQRQEQEQQEQQELNRSDSQIMMELPDTTISDDNKEDISNFLCGVCGMTFKNAGNLERHVKFSSMHASVMNNYIESLFHFMTEEQLLSLQNAVDDADEDLGPTYTLFMTDSKLFWRTQDSFVVDLYLHASYNCMEAVIQNTKSKNDSNSIYFDYKLLSANTVRQYGKQRTIKAFNEFLVAFVMDRLFQDKETNRVIYQATTADASDLYPVLKRPPRKITPAGQNEWRLHRSDSSEIEAAVSGLEGEKQQLLFQTSQAEKYSNSTTEAVEYLRSIVTNPLPPDLVKQVPFGEYSPFKKPTANTSSGGIKGSLSRGRLDEEERLDSLLTSPPKSSPLKMPIR